MMKAKKYLSGGDVKQVKTIASKQVKQHEKSMHGMAKGGGVKIRGTGAATKGLRARGPMA
jgi:hypothetical protein